MCRMIMSYHTVGSVVLPINLNAFLFFSIPLAQSSEIFLSLCLFLFLFFPPWIFFQPLLSSLIFVFSSHVPEILWNKISQKIGSTAVVSLCGCFPFAVVSLCLPLSSLAFRGRMVLHLVCCCLFQCSQLTSVSRDTSTICHPIGASGRRRKRRPSLQV